MIATTFEEVHSREWIKTYIIDPTNELIILRDLIPWEKTMKRLAQFYNTTKGALGKSLRMMIALVLLSRLRELSDRQLIAAIRENRYMQYFCNIPDHELGYFLDESTLSTFRSRLGPEGIAIIEHELFHRLRRSGAIEGDAALLDASSLPNNIIYPNDVRLLFVALRKMAQWALDNGLSLGVSQQEIKQDWLTFNKDKKSPRWVYLIRFYLLFYPALDRFETLANPSGLSPLAALRAQDLLKVLRILDAQTQQKLLGQASIKNRLVSLHETEARPLKKGKAFPPCEFGSTNQMSFNRQGFMITTEILIGQPNETTLYQHTLQLYIQRMGTVPPTAVTDLGCRSEANLNYRPEGLKQRFLGRSDDVAKEHREFCQKARSATEGFIAVAKNLRGFGKSLYRGLRGDKIWASLCQAAYNLKKFFQLYGQEQFEESVLIKLGLLS